MTAIGLTPGSTTGWTAGISSELASCSDVTERRVSAKGIHARDCLGSHLMAIAASTQPGRCRPLPSSKVPPIECSPDHRLVAAHLGREMAEEPLELPALLARGIGQAVGHAASEIPPAPRQVELGYASRRAAVPAHERADEPPPHPAIGRPGRHEPDAVVGGLAPGAVVQPKPSVSRIAQVGLSGPGRALPGRKAFSEQVFARQIGPALLDGPFAPLCGETNPSKRAYQNLREGCPAPGRRLAFY
jgi:hypothetical protein